MSWVIGLSAIREQGELGVGNTAKKDDPSADQVSAYTSYMLCPRGWYAPDSTLTLRPRHTV